MAALGVQVVFRETMMVALAALVMGCERRTELPDHVVLTRFEPPEAVTTSTCSAAASRAGTSSWALTDV